jgi:integrase
MYRALAHRADDKPLTTMADIIDRYSLKILPTKSIKTQKSQVLYLKRIKNVFGAMAPEIVRPVHIYTYRSARAKKNATTANRELELIKHLFRMAVQWGVVDDNPAREVSKMKLPKRTRYVKDSEYQAVYVVAPPMVRVAMDLAVLIGLRRADLLALTRQDLIDEGISVHTRKTDKPLIIEWSQALRRVVTDALRLPPHVRQPIIANRRGKAYTGDGFGANWQRVIKKALKCDLKEPFRFHDLRAKSASDDDDLDVLVRNGWGMPTQGLRSGSTGEKGKG